MNLSLILCNYNDKHCFFNVLTFARVCPGERLCMKSIFDMSLLSHVLLIGSSVLPRAQERDAKNKSAVSIHYIQFHLCYYRPPRAYT